MSSETIMPGQMDAHAPHKTKKIDLWKTLAIVASVSTVIAVTLAVVFGFNTSSLKTDLAKVKMQRTEVEDRMASLLLDKKAA